MNSVLSGFYKSWEAFTFKGEKFIALFTADCNFHIFGTDFTVQYGSWLSVANFKKRYAVEREALRLS